MKRTIIAVALAAVAVTSFAATDAYRSNAGQSDQENVVRQQLGDAGSYSNTAGDRDQSRIQLGDASDTYHNNAGEQDQHQPQYG